MKCMPSMSVFIHLKRLRINEDSLKGDDIDGLLLYFVLFLYYFFNAVAPARSSPNMASYWLVDSVFSSFPFTDGKN